MIDVKPITPAREGLSAYVVREKLHVRQSLAWDFSALLTITTREGAEELAKRLLLLSAELPSDELYQGELRVKFRKPEGALYPIEVQRECAREGHHGKLFMIPNGEGDQICERCLAHIPGEPPQVQRAVYVIASGEGEPVQAARAWCWHPDRLHDVQLAIAAGATGVVIGSTIVTWGELACI